MLPVAKWKRMTGNPALIDWIRRRIAAEGWVTFRWFMEQALYHPQHGYYASGRAAIGRKGDYFTNVSVGPLFGRLLAAQFSEMREHLGRPAPFTIVEQGANDGQFAKDVLAAIQETRGAADMASLRYVIVEPFERLRNRQIETLGDFSNVSWQTSLAAIEPFEGVHFSNELIDAMPVHLVRFVNGQWLERYVSARWELVDGPVSSGELSKRLERIPRIENYRTEVNLDAPAWIRQLSAKLTRGYVLAVDYGYPRDVYYNPERSGGTLACYSRHRRNDSPLEAVGEADITAHVDFTSLAEQAAERGLELAGFTDQHHFMVGLGKTELAGHEEGQTPENQKRLRAFATLMHPALMGGAFKVLALRKGIGDMPLRGFEGVSNPKCL
jgi:SAM-dependent MidA family methyltransferase